MRDRIKGEGYIATYLAHKSWRTRFYVLTIICTVLYFIGRMDADYVIGLAFNASIIFLIAENKDEKPKMEKLARACATQVEDYEKLENELRDAKWDIKNLEYELQRLKREKE